jgi:peptidoglycan/xylan/chitin deacetylase (PgdA/CDA1 family)
MRPRLKPLTREQHLEVARLLNQAQDCIEAATQIACHAKGARYTDDSLRVRRDLQNWLINPLRWAWDETREPIHESPYQAIGYCPSAGPRRRRVG